MRKKTYVFRRSGQDEGWVVSLSQKEAREIWRRLDQLSLDDQGRDTGESPFYLYPMLDATVETIHEFLDAEE